MKCHLFFTGLGLILLLALIAGGPTDTNETSRTAPTPDIYARELDALIAACEKSGTTREKNGMFNEERDSLSLLKGYFFSQNKNRLISKMMAACVSPTPEAIRYFADKHFFAVLHSFDPSIAKTYLAPWQERPSALARLQH